MDIKKTIIRLVLLSFGAWSVLQVGHEMIGHGLTVLLVGAKPVSVNAMYFHYDLSSVSTSADRWIRAGGSIFNVVWAMVCLLLLTKKALKNFEFGYFIWVSCVINFCQSGAYIAFGRFINDGMDWAMILNGVEDPELWQFLELIVGLLLLGVGTWVAYKYGTLFTKTEITRSSKRLFWIPLFASTILSVTSSLIMPTDHRFMMLMGGLGNGFTFLFPLFFLGFFKLPKRHFQLDYRPSNRVLTFSIMLSVFYIFFMTPGITF